MRRLVAGLFLIVFALQSSGPAVAATDATSKAPQFAFGAIFGSIEAAVVGSQLYADATGMQDRYAAMHAPRPVMQKLPSRDAAAVMRAEHGLTPRIRHGVRLEVTMPPRSALDPRHRRLDPLAMRKSRTAEASQPHSTAITQGLIEPLRSLVASAQHPRGAGPNLRRQSGPKEREQILSGGTTGIEPWWTYEERAIPGIGKAMVNVGTGNLLVSAVDADIHEQGIDLALQRVYNSQSLHDYQGDDGGDPAIFGNHWTNNFDTNIVYNSSANTITVYDIDGAACTYTSNGLGTWQPCTGEYATLAPTDDTSCSYVFTKKDGTAYWFHTDDSGNGACTIQQAKAGHLEEICGRNVTNCITFSYSYDGSPKNSENVSQIVATHSDGQTLVMNFGDIPGTSINELGTVALPDGQEKLQYSYDTNGNLVEVDKPGNNSATSVPANPNQNIAVPQGDAPETYAYASGTSNLSEACGPRCTVATWINPTAPTDGSALLFTLDSSLQLSSWAVNGVLNFTPTDSSATPTLLQPGEQIGFRNWYSANFVYGTGSACNNTSSGTTTMCDSDGHSTIWTTNSNLNVTQTQHYTGTAENLWLVTNASWDSNDDLTSTTDANGNITKYGYDTGGYNQGNVVEMELPRATDFNVGQLTPISYYSYDQFNNVTAYCDPVYNATQGNGWNNSYTDNLCPAGSQKTTQLGYTYTDPNEPFGCLDSIQKPSGLYTTAITYFGGTGVCGVGLPKNTQAAQAITQYDGTNRTPVADFSYDGYGNLQTSDQGSANGNTLDSWTLLYDSDNHLYNATQHDAVIQSPAMHSFTCRYADGSTFYTETPSQHNTDGNNNCPSVTQLLGGNVSPPAAATAHYYDLDGDEVQTITHKGCNTTGCSGTTPHTVCAPNESAMPIGTTCKYYDGLDRLVETAEPYDTRSFSDSKQYEFYGFRWMNRYIYDLSGAGGGANLKISDQTGTINGIVAYGGLFKTQEYLPQNSTMQVLYNATVPNPGWSDVRGSSFDGLDRVVNKYELAYGTSAINGTKAVTTNSYDAINQYGLLSSTENALGQTISYSYDNISRVEGVSFSSGDGDPRTYTFDPDGRTATAANSMGTMTYTYDVDGNTTSVQEPNDPTNGEMAASLICYSYYPDGLREYVSIFPVNISNCNSKSQNLNPGNGGIEQPDVFSYSYTNDGRLKKQLVTWSTTALFQWAYYPSGREESETDPATGDKAYMGPGPNAPTTTLSAKQYSYDPYGRISTLTIGGGGWTENSISYDIDDEMLGYTINGGSAARALTLNARGEVLEDTSGIAMAQNETQSANGAAVGDGDTGVGNNEAAYPPTTLKFDVRTNMVTCMPNPQWALGITDSIVYAYDAAGRQTGSGMDNNQNQTDCSQSYATQSASYDAENHVVHTYNYSGGLSGGAHWGADSKQRTDTIWDMGQSYPESAHWDGDSMLFSSFTTSSASVGLYVGKNAIMDNTGNIFVVDRDQSGNQVSSHGHTITPSPSYELNGYWFDGWNLGSLRTIYIAKAGKQITLQYESGSCNATWNNQSYPCPGSAASFPMGRTDGYGMTGGIIQGARAFDPVAGQWTSPDAYAGDVHDPMSQKPFMWNGNNPVQWADPSGYLLVAEGDTDQKQTEMSDWDAMKAQFQNNPQAMAIINDIEKNPNFTVMLSENNLGQTQFSGTYEDGKLTSDRIDFDPHTAISYDDQGHAISPALALLHEAAHADRFNTDYNGYAQDIENTNAGGYGNMEEKRVITGIESQILGSEGLPARTDHGGTPCTVTALSSSQC